MSRDIEQDVAFIRALAALLRECDLTEIEVEREYGEDDELKVRLTRSPPAAVQMVPAPAPPAPVATAAQVPPADAPPALQPGEVLASPMVGTAYLSPEPGAAAFVQIGEQVAEGQTVLIIEAMKTMNQIPAPRAGVVRQILIGNAEPVEYGAPLMVIG
jgi:acetyl-CoA carboxylase biotin carboxyl carrier protein